MICLFAIDSAVGMIRKEPAVACKRLKRQFENCGGEAVIHLVFLPAPSGRAMIPVSEWRVIWRLVTLLSCRNAILVSARLGLTQVETE